MERIKMIIFIGLLYSSNLKGQIELLNPSFEDCPLGEEVHLYKDWLHCRTSKIAPDIHADYSNFYKIAKDAADGEKYAGLKVKENGSYGKINQRLESSLKRGVRYQISIMASKSDIYMKEFPGGAQKLPSGVHVIRESKEIYYENAVIIRVWGAQHPCNNLELLGQTSLIDNEEWQDYEIQFSPKEGSYQTLIIEAYYESEKEFYNGHVLIDHISEITELEN